MGEEDSLRRSYDQVPYPSFAFPFTHPSRLAALARLAGLDTLIMALAAGFYIRNFAPLATEQLRTELQREGGGAGGAGGAGSPVYVVFFALTGAGMRVGALAELWPWMLLLVGLRVVSLRYGTLWAARHPSVGPPLARYGWLGLVSQAGVALSLAQLSRKAFPEWGVSLESLIVAMIGVHEVVGPICFRTALVRAGEATEETSDAEAAVRDRAVVTSRGGL